jgi:Transglutaminase-like superfamily
MLLPMKEKLLLLRICFRLRSIRIALNRRTFQSVLEDVRHWSNCMWVLRGGILDTRLICQWVERCAGILPENYSCLSQAFTGYVICRKYGHCPELLLGTSKADEHELQAHAWLELKGEVVLGDLPDLEQYQSFDRLDTLLS